MKEVNTGVYHICVANDDNFDKIVEKVLIFKNSIAPNTWLIMNE